MGPGRVKTARRLARKDRLEYVALQAMCGRKTTYRTSVRLLALIKIHSGGEMISGARF